MAKAWWQPALQLLLSCFAWVIIYLSPLQLTVQLLYFIDNSYFI